MRPSDLTELEGVLLQADSVVPMRDVHAGHSECGVIGLRHDVDDNPGSLDTAVQMALWEKERGFRSTYFLLHTAHYWSSASFQGNVQSIADCGHEIGIHANALTVALTSGGDPVDILQSAIEDLRTLGHSVTGVAPHGDKACYEYHFINDEMFAECPRRAYGSPTRKLAGLGGLSFDLDPQPLSLFGLEYETYRLPRGRYLSDSGGRWNIPPEQIAARDDVGQLHILQHPDWWAGLF